jgi:hypothetical protein
MAEVARENQIFGDIVFLDYEDTYRGVGHKTINMCIFASKIKYADYLIRLLSCLGNILFAS